MRSEGERQAAGRVLLRGTDTIASEVFHAIFLPGMERNKFLGSFCSVSGNNMIEIGNRI